MADAEAKEAEEAAKKAKEEELWNAAGSGKDEDVDRLLEEGVSADAVAGTHEEPALMTAASIAASATGCGGTRGKRGDHLCTAERKGSANRCWHDAHARTPVRHWRRRTERGCDTLSTVMATASSAA